MESAGSHRPPTPPCSADPHSKGDPHSRGEDRPGGVNVGPSQRGPRTRPRPAAMKGTWWGRAHRGRDREIPDASDRLTLMCRSLEPEEAPDLMSSPVQQIQSVGL